ncbi:11024_t:CDS:1, partial [Scutellospora calospora]
YCCYDEIIETKIVSSDNDKNLAFLYDLMIKTEIFFKNTKIIRSSEYSEIEKLINNAIYSNRKIVDIEREIYNRIIDSNSLNNDEKIKLQSLR